MSGGEYEVLLGTDFTQFKAGVIMVDAEIGTSDLAVQLLDNAGYTNCQRVASNLVCTHSDFVPSLYH